MKKLWQQSLWALVMGVVVPALVVSAALWLAGLEEESAPNLTARVRQGESVTQMAMDEYLVGVVLAELPADFETEAVKAQAVASRTYAVKALATGGKHGDGSVCTDSACCQGYTDPENSDAAWVQSVRGAVEDTTGEVLTYDGELIEAVYFACSGGRTEDAVAVWGTDYPYLRATDSPGEESAAYYTDTLTMSAQELCEKLGRTLPGDPSGWFTDVTHTAGGGVDTMTIAGETYSGTQLRTLLGLRSTAFTAAAQDDTVTFTTRGYGHRVGMSQYGADAMAAAGSDYRAILAHYYAGTTLEQATESLLAN